MVQRSIFVGRGGAREGGRGAGAGFRSVAEYQGNETYLSSCVTIAVRVREREKVAIQYPTLSPPLESIVGE